MATYNFYRLIVESATNRKFYKNNCLLMESGTIEINVAEYYAKPAYYEDMPEVVFNALEAAFISGAETAIVPKEAFETMIRDFENGRQEA